MHSLERSEGDSLRTLIGTHGSSTSGRKRRNNGVVGLFQHID
jgi:hypothetical protein